MTTRWYRISNFWPARIQPVEVESETETFLTVVEKVYFSNGEERLRRSRFAKVCGTQQFFQTFAEAKAAVLARETQQVESLRRKLEQAEQAVKALAAMTEAEAK